MTRDPKRTRLAALIRDNDLSLAAVSVAIGRNETYVQQYLRRGMPPVLAFQGTETLGRLLGCDPSELRYETRPPRAPQPRTRRTPTRRHALASACSSGNRNREGFARAPPPGFLPSTRRSP